jgi:5-methylcytosine-specific restriction enzyme B
MARFSNFPKFTDVLKAAEDWKKNCLLQDGSVFFPNTELWTLQNLQELDTHFVEAPIFGKQRFIEKLEIQLKPTSSVTKKLAAEIIWFMLLFPSNIGHKAKVSRILEVWSWSGDTLDPSHPLLANPLENGIGSTGPGLNTRFPVYLGSFVKVLEAWKQLEPASQAPLLGDGWGFGNWLDGRILRGQLRHIMLYCKRQSKHMVDRLNAQPA